MKAGKPRLINPEKRKILCNKCKFGYLIDKKHDTYYCIPEDSSKSKVTHGSHSCVYGEHK